MKFFEAVIRRPVATSLLTLGAMLSGLVAWTMLPVAPLPQVELPTISVTAQLPGASPETMASAVATPLERALGSISGITEMTSSSSLGRTRITIQFDLSRDIESAARDVQAAINAARTMLPSGMPRNPTYRKVNPANAPVLIIALTSDTMTRGQIYDAAATVLAQMLSQVEGVGDVMIGGSSLPAVRVELNPMQVNHYGLSLETVRRAIANSNANSPKGMIEYGDRQWQVAANDQAFKADEYRRLIVSHKDGAAVRLEDIADVMDSVQDVRNAGMSDGKPSVLLIVRTQAGANIIETVDRVKALLPVLKASVPSSIDFTVTQDRTLTIRASLREVTRTLAIAVGLVILMVFLFLRNGRATLVPCVAVPVSLMTTLAVMYLCGFTLNNLSLMALTVATGFVVDDAIVVIENINRHREAGKSPFRAALDGVSEVGFTVVSMSLSLIAVFIPLLLMGGVEGRYFHEFAVTLSAAILVSLVVALTTIPMLCAHWLKPEPKEHGTLYLFGDRVFQAVHNGYRRSLSWSLSNKSLMLAILLATVTFNAFLYKNVPKGYFPTQDTGRIVSFIRADQSISFQAMQEKYEGFIQIIRQDPAVEAVSGFIGGGGQVNRGSIFITLKPLSERKISAREVITRLQRALAKEPGARLTMMPAQDIRIGGREASAEFQYTLQADDIHELRTWEPQVRQALRQLPQITDVDSDQDDRGVQTMLTIDRDVVARLGLTVAQVNAALNDAFGQRQVSTIYNPLNQYQVVMTAAPPFAQSAQSLQNIYLVARDGSRVPLSAVASYTTENTALSVNHQGQFVTATFSFNLASGVALSEAAEAVHQAVARTGLPVSVVGSLQGTAGAFEKMAATQLILILAALIVVYLVLGILYESFVHPLTILSTLPSAGVGALLAIELLKKDFNLITLLGVLLLIGLVMKNAIMMIDFALAAERQHRMAPRDAIFTACLLRFRPIMMTTLTAIFAALPLMLGRGDGAELRQPLGLAIVGGLMVSQLLTLYTTPVVYLYIHRLREYLTGRKAETGPLSPVEV
ncbi:MAG: multidrug efflux RND transporter permease subunit [Proteobacteria bacterium]|nr:multidrug efflux RND transporter permease subunit [Pseudomonadota bacterium]MCL2307555.1 multidrug efflux RND transporter permease subunit [Pseudomonadota bacterium]